ASHSGGSRFNVGDARHDAECLVIDLLADIRESNAPRRSLEELYAKLLFEMRKAAADVGLVAPQSIGRLGEAAALHDFDEGRQGAEVHNVAIIVNNTSVCSSFVRAVTIIASTCS